MIDEMKSPLAVGGRTKHLAQQDRPPPIYPTSATDPDSDNDWLPDGAEIHFYGSNPMDTDSDNDGIADTYEFDTDFDALPDGIEFKIGLQGVFGGGILNPDSDHDGLLDGDEYYTYGTDPAKLDTDGDGYSDGLEVALGLDPLVFTSKDEFEMALALERGQNTLKIMTPVEGQEAYDRVQVSVANFTPFQDVWFEYLNDTDWSEGIFLNYSPAAQQWQSAGVRWSPGNYSLRVFGRNGTGIIHAATSWFIVLGPEPFPWLLIAAIAGGVAAVVIVGFLGYKKGWWQRISRRIRGKPEDKATKKTPNKEPATKKKTAKKESPSKGEKGGG